MRYVSIWLSISVQFELIGGVEFNNLLLKCLPLDITCPPFCYYAVQCRLFNLVYLYGFSYIFCCRLIVIISSSSFVSDCQSIEYYGINQLSKWVSVNINLLDRGFGTVKWSYFCTYRNIVIEDKSQTAFSETLNLKKTLLIASKCQINSAMNLITFSLSVPSGAFIYCTHLS